MASTITLQSIANFCSTHSDLLPLTGVGGYTSEPFISIANDAMAEIINDVQEWKWNSVETCDLVITFAPLITSLNKQDYLFAGASAFVLQVSGTTQVTSSGAAIDLVSNNGVTVSGGVVTVKTLEPHRFAVGNIVNLLGLVFTTGTAANYNSAFSDNGSVTSWSTGYTITAVTTKSFSFAAVAGHNNSDVGGAPGFGVANGGNVQLQGMGWLSGAGLMELNNNSSPPNWRQIKAVRSLSKWSRIDDPERVAVIQDYGTGVLRIRFQQIPGGVISAVNLIYQAAKPLLTNMGGTWSPIPDKYDDLIRQAALYRCYRYLNPNSSATVNEFKKFEGVLAKSKGVDMAEESNVYLQPEEGLVDDFWPSYGGTY
jgi:hypothetical protein